MEEHDMLNEMQMLEIRPQRNSTGNAFTQGVIDMNFSIGNHRIWIPSKSYVRIKTNLSTANVAYADNFAAALWQNVYFRVGGQDISSVVSNYPQADQCLKRLEKAQTYIDGVGEAVGYDALAIKPGEAQPAGFPLISGEKVTMWCPAVGAFKINTGLGSGDYRLSLSPNVNFKTACVRHNNDATDDAAAAANDLEILDLSLFICTARANTNPSGTEKFILHEQLVSSKPCVQGSNTLDFVCPTSTTGLSFFIQDARAGAAVGGNGSRVRPLPLTYFKNAQLAADIPAVNDDDLAMSSIQVTYAGATKPSIRYQTNANTVAQRYYDTHLQARGLELITGPEGLDTYKQLGAIHHMDFAKPADDRSTHVNLQIDLPTLNTVDHTVNLFCVAHYTRAVSITTEQGYVTNVVSVVD